MFWPHHGMETWQLVLRVPTCSFVGVDARELYGAVMTSLRVFLVLFQDIFRCVPIRQPIIYQVNLQHVHWDIHTDMNKVTL